MSKLIVTHDGKFHADDVFAVAILKRIYPDASVMRTRKESDIQRADIVVDVGGTYDEASLRFDHHQVGGADVRKNSVPYASFGLVWRTYGKQLCGSDSVALRIEEVLVVPIDANDNGVALSSPTVTGASGYELSDAIRAFVPTWQEGMSMVNERFNEAVLFAGRIIDREIVRAKALIAGEEEVLRAYAQASDKSLIVLESDLSWKSILSKFPEPLFVVHPQDEAWRIYTVRDNPHVFTNRKDLPEAWAGLRDEALVQATGVADAVFCHRNRFMAVAKSKEGILELARQARA